jgi:hypothetical protein
MVHLAHIRMAFAQSNGTRASPQQAETTVARSINGVCNPVNRHSSFGFQSFIAFGSKARGVS